MRQRTRDGGTLTSRREVQAVDGDDGARAGDGEGWHRGTALLTQPMHPNPRLSRGCDVQRHHQKERQCPPPTTTSFVRRHFFKKFGLVRFCLPPSSTTTTVRASATTRCHPCVRPTLPQPSGATRRAAGSDSPRACARKVNTRPTAAELATRDKVQNSISQATTTSFPPLAACTRLCRFRTVRLFA